MNTYYIAGYPISDELYHHGIKGQRWGVRRYQNEDGSLTADGRIRYGDNSRSIQRDLNRLDREKAYTIGDRAKAIRKYEKETRKLNKHKNDKSEEWKQKYQAKADAAAKKKDAYEKRYAELSSDTKHLVDRAISQGMNVNISAIPRSTQRFGEVFARETLGWTMAVGTAMLLPIGIGVSQREYTRGSHYQVRKPKD